uniref:LXG domain-containing protein n=1 Tax=Salmonella enterica subsp. enterica serovar Saintpaul TaxID=90105 RepID=A0A1S0Z7P2_SALET
MSDDIIKVLDLPGIAEYSQSINKFSKSLSTATNDTARTFNIQIEGSEGEAINAFLQSLNDLQGKIFNQIPEVLKKYATVVSDFESSVSGIGFTNEAWTSGTGNTSVQNKLTGSQKETLQSVAKTLQSALDTATDALGESTIDLSVITNTTSSSLDDASKERLNTHTPFQSAHDTFSQNLQQVLESITTLKGSVGQAQITLNLSPKAVFNMLAQGLHMNPLDTINNIDEAKALDSVYGDNQALISQVNRNNVRDTVVFLMVDGMATWVKDKSTDKLQSFYNEIGKMELADSSAWLDKFTTSGQSLAIVHQADMALKFEQVGHDYSKMKAEFIKENAINEVIGINRGLYSIKFGKKTFKPNGSNISVADPQQISFEFNSDGRTIFRVIGQASGYKVEGFKSTTQEYSSDFKVNSSELNKEEITHRLEELDQKRKEIVFETLRDVASGVASMAFSKYGAAFKLLKLVGAEAHDAIDSQMSSEVASVVKGVENWKKVSTEELEQIAKLKREMVGKGGWIFEGGTPSDGSNQRIVSDTSYYRFEVSQRIAEMDKYGTKLFFEKYKTQEEFTTFENKLRDSQNKIDEDVANYVLGKDSSLSFETMDRKQLEQVNKAIELMDEIQDDTEADDGAKYFDYLKAKYNRNININH